MYSIKLELDNSENVKSFFEKNIIECSYIIIFRKVIYDNLFYKNENE